MTDRALEKPIAKTSILPVGDKIKYDKPTLI
jgi:hypothetical protein